MSETCMDIFHIWLYMFIYIHIHAWNIFYREMKTFAFLNKKIDSFFEMRFHIFRVKFAKKKSEFFPSEWITLTKKKKNLSFLFKNMNIFNKIGNKTVYVIVDTLL